VAAAEWFKAAGRPDDAVRLACALDEYIALRGPFSLTLRLLDDASLCTVSPELRARAHVCRGRAFVLTSRRANALRELAEAESQIGADERSATAAKATLWRSLLSYWLFDAGEAARGFARAAVRAREANALPDAALALLYLGCTLGESGRHVEAERVFSEAAELVEDLGIVALRPRLVVYRAHFLPGKVPTDQLQQQRAEALTLTERLQDLRFSSAVLTALGDLGFLAGDPARALGHYERAVQRYQDIGFVTAVPLVRFSYALAQWLAEDL